MQCGLVESNWLDKLVDMKKVKYTPPTYGKPVKVQEVGAFAAKTHLSAILEKVAHGETFYITKHGKPIAEIRPIEKTQTRPKAGFAKGQIWMAPDFDDPLPEMKPYME